MRNVIAAAVLGLSIAFSFASVPQAVSAVPAAQFAACAGERILTFPNWYQGLPDTNCNIQITKLTDFWVIVLNILEAVIQAAGYIAVGFIIWGGIKFIKSQGDPGQINESRDTIVNASIGLAIVLVSVSIINFVTGTIK
jgi:hypothetical protein